MRHEVFLLLLNKFVLNPSNHNISCKSRVRITCRFTGGSHTRKANLQINSTFLTLTIIIEDIINSSGCSICEWQKQLHTLRFNSCMFVVHCDSQSVGGDYYSMQRFSGQ